MEKKRKAIFLSLVILSTIIIPALCIIVCSRGRPFRYSLSRIAGDNNAVILLWILGNFLILFLLLLMNYFKMYHSIGNKFTSIIFYISSILLEITICVPYKPHEYPIQSSIHNITAYSAVPLLVVGLLFILLSLPKLSRNIYKISVITFVIIISISYHIFQMRDNTTAFFEVTLIFLCTNFFSLTLYRLYKMEVKKIDGSFKIRYKIRTIKKLNLQTYDVESDIKYPVFNIMEHNNIIKGTKDNIFPIVKKIYIFYNNCDGTTKIGFKTNRKKDNVITYEKKKWAIFLLDETSSETRKYTLNYISSFFEKNSKYKIASNTYIEKYIVIGFNNVRKAEIWLNIESKD